MSIEEMYCSAKHAPLEVTLYFEQAAELREMETSSGGDNVTGLVSRPTTAERERGETSVETAYFHILIGE